VRLLDSFSIVHPSGTRRVELFHGDLAQIPRDEAVDVLVVSAFPDDYRPTAGSLIGELDRQGLSLAALAGRKAVDLRQAFSCWLSEDLGTAAERFGFRRILCFEPQVRGAPEDVVGEIFQSLMPLAYGDPPIRTLAMPLVASGDQGVATSAILTPLLDAAAQWLARGLPIERIKIVERSQTKVAELVERFAKFKHDRPAVRSQDRRSATYDVFFSYSHQNVDAVAILEGALRQLRPDVRIFIDRQRLAPGHSWQQTIFEALDDCETVVTLYSPAYLRSSVCKDEFNVALLRHRESERGVLLPIYLASAELPTYMKLIQYEDCREGDPEKLAQACHRIAQRIGTAAT
jgi:hypothetical protein